MNVLLTDLLTCPRCGPGYGLILLVDHAESHRVLEGSLGCANCSLRYAVRGGFADLRGGGAGQPDRLPPEPGADAEAAYRLAALMGVSEGPGFVLVVGPGAGLASGLAELLPELEVVAVAGSLESQGETRGISRLAYRGQLPFRTGSMRAVALTGEASSALEEGARVLAGGGRLVLEPAPAGVAERLRSLGLEVVAADSGTVVAARD